jgi:DnaJ-class molecular chaperone
MSKFYALVNTLSVCACDACDGLGKKMSAPDISDLSRPKTKCKRCKGTGFKDGTVLKLVKMR